MASINLMFWFQLVNLCNEQGSKQCPHSKVNANSILEKKYVSKVNHNIISNGFLCGCSNLCSYANAGPFSSMPTSIETWWHLQVKEMTEQHNGTAQEKEEAKRRRDQTQFLAECVRRIPSVYWEPTNCSFTVCTTRMTLKLGIIHLRKLCEIFSFVTISDGNFKDLFQSSWNMKPPSQESFTTSCCVWFCDFCRRFSTAEHHAEQWELES